MNDLRSDQCSNSSLHNTFCSPFTTKELTTAISKLSTSTASGPDLIAYLLLIHLLLQLSNIFSPSSTGPGFHTPFLHAGNLPPLFPYTNTAISKLFERLVLNRLCYYLESKNLISPTQAGFRPGRSTTDQVLLLTQNIWDGFQKKKPPDRTVLATIDFSKAFDSVWHSALFYKLLILGLPPCFVCCTCSFLSDRRANVFFRGARSRSFRIKRVWLCPWPSPLHPIRRRPR